MRHTLLTVLVLLLAARGLAQSAEDKKASLAGLTRIAIQEIGVAKLGGGTAGSPFVLQVKEPFLAAGGTVADIDDAADKGLPIYQLLCTGMDWSDGSIRVACEARLMRQVFLGHGTEEAPARSVYASVWTSKMIIASFPDYGAAQFGLDKVTVQLVEQFMADWSAANPTVKPAAKPAVRKK